MNDIYLTAWQLVRERIEGKTSWGKNELKHLLLSCLVEAGSLSGVGIKPEVAELAPEQALEMLETLEMLRAQACTPAVMKKRLRVCCEHNSNCPFEAECKRLYDEYVDAIPKKRRKNDSL
jgi:RecB family exonuclease